MVDNLEEENLTNPESIEDVEGDIESPEDLFETPEQLDQLVEDTTEKIDTTSEEFKTEGIEKVDSAVKEYNADPSETADTKSELAGIHEEVDELAEGSKEIIEGEKKIDFFESLNPQEIIDEEGIERKIFTFSTDKGKDVKVLFYSPDELPYSDEMVDGRQGFIIGEQPPVRSKEEWDKFRQKIQQGSKSDVSPTTDLPVPINEARTAGKSSFFVESSPQALLDMAFYLGVEDKKLREMRRLLAQGETSEEIEELMDQVIAGKMINTDGNIRTDRNEDGEALVLLALQGNEEARQELEKRKTLLTKHDELNQKEKLSDIQRRAEAVEKKNSEVEPLDINSLVAVHTTKFKPKKHGDGYSMESTFDGSKGDMMRNTVHFTLNHHVASHNSGNWDHSPYVVLSPLKDMIDENGKPANINTVDTYFEQNPNEPLELPEGTYMIQPGKVKSGELFTMDENGSVVYKDGSIETKDIEAMSKKLSPEKMSLIDSSLVSAIENSLRHHVKFEDEKLNKDYNERYILSHEVYSAMQKLWEDSNWKAVFIPKCQEMGIENAVNDLLDQAGISDKLKTSERSQVIEAVHNTIRSEIKMMAVKETISQMGFKNHTGGMWAWDGDSFDATDATTQLANKMGVATGPHSSTAESNLTEEYYQPMESLKEGKINIAQYREDSERINKRRLADISPKTRRMLYARGLL